MTGIEILATQEVAIGFSFNWCLLIISILSITAISVLVGWLEDPHNAGWLVGLIVGVVASVLLGIILGFTLGRPAEYETQYKVLISDEVSMNDFLERYEIVDQEGKIYTIREIE